MDFFKPEDCDYKNITKLQFSDGVVHWASSNSIDLISPIKANRLLRERGVQMRGRIENEKHLGFCDASTKCNTDTHQALLVCIEPIEQDSAEKILSDYLENCEIDFVEFQRRAKALLNKRGVG